MIYLYGLIEMDGNIAADVLAEMPATLGPVSAHRLGEWVMLSSDFAGEEVLPKRRLMLAHTRIVETMMDHGTVLPARFGLLADDLAAVTALIDGRRTQIAAEFMRVRGCVELGVRITYPRDAALQATLQADTSLQKKRDALAGQGAEAHFARAAFGRQMAEQLDRRRGAAQRTVLQTLIPQAKSHVLRAPEEDVEVLRAEFLIQRSAQDGFLAAVEDAANGLSFAPGAEPRVQVIGPVPPYNFVRLSLTAEDTEAAA